MVLIGEGNSSKPVAIKLIYASHALKFVSGYQFFVTCINVTRHWPRSFWFYGNEHPV